LIYVDWRIIINEKYDKTSIEMIYLKKINTKCLWKWKKGKNEKM